jgi:uncharacterized surface protein with fasciclin (FAS1) repeats
LIDRRMGGCYVSDRAARARRGNPIRRSACDLLSVGDPVAQQPALRRGHVRVRRKTNRPSQPYLFPTTTSVPCAHRDGRRRVVRYLGFNCNNQEFPMSNRFSLVAAAAALAIIAGTAGTTTAISQEKTVMVGGAAMYPSKNIVQNAANSKDHTTLVAAVKAASLVDTLSSPGPFTVFAPTNTAFGKLPAGTVDTLVKPENKATLTKILTYHVVAGRMTANDLMKAVKNGEGMAKLKTVAGGELTVKQAGPGKLSITDAKGGTAMVTIADVLQSNGVIHVIDTVLMPM